MMIRGSVKQMRKLKVFAYQNLDSAQSNENNQDQNCRN